MRPWMDEPPHAGALFPRFVCRVSGAPADAVDRLRAERTFARFAELERVERRLREAREEVSGRLFAAIGAAGEDRAGRNRLIALKRDLYNLRVPSAGALDAALAGVEPSTAAAARAFAGELERGRAVEAELRQGYEAEAADLRRRCAALLEDPDFRKGLLISSRSLYAGLEGYAAAAAAGEVHGRHQKAERGLLRYFTRMATKATPFSTFCAIIPGTFADEAADGPEGAIRFTADPRAKRSFVRINKLLYGLLLDHLKTRPAVRRALPVEPNPTLRTEGRRLVFLTAVEGREVFQRIADNEVLRLIAERIRGGGATLGDLVRALASDPAIEATPEEAGAYTDRLVEIGFLRFRTGIREQDADWDLPFRALLDRIPDDHARRASALLAALRERIRAYTDADVAARQRIVHDVQSRVDAALDAMQVGGRPPRDVPFYEDATSPASARVALTPGVRRAFAAFERWVRATSRLAWPRPEQATMRHFFADYYADEEAAAGVPLLKFYEDFYREHFKAHVEKEAKQHAGDDLEGYDPANPFGLDFVRRLSGARGRMAELVRRRWSEARDAESLDLSPEEVEDALRGVETRSAAPRSMGAFGLLVPADAGGGEPAFVLHGPGYTAGYGKYFSRFLYMLPDDVQEDVRRANAALTGGMLAEICGDAQFNANLHPPLLRWEISYPTGESGATDQQLRSSEILVQPDPEDPHALALVHAPSGRRVFPVDLGFLTPRMRPPLYQLLSRFTPPAMYAPALPESPEAPRKAEAGVEDASAAASSAGGAMEAGSPPGPRVEHRPRITFAGRLVLSRRRWTVPDALFPQRRPDEGAVDFFLRANRWRGEHGIPDVAYLRMIPLPAQRRRTEGERAPEEPPAAPAGIPGYDAPAAEAEAPPTDGEARPEDRRTRPSRDYYKPQFIDFGSPLLVGVLGKAAAGLERFSAVFEERYPAREQLARYGDAGFATELVVQLYFPGGTAPAGEGAGALAAAEGA